MNRSLWAVIVSTTLAVLLVASSPVALADDRVVVNNSGNTPDTLQEAIGDVSSGGTIILTEERSPYEGVKIDSKKAFKIKGQGVVSIQAKQTMDAPIVIGANDDKRIKIENVILVGEGSNPSTSTTSHAVIVRSNTQVELKNVVIDSSIDGVPFVLDDNIGSRRPTGSYFVENGVYYHDGIDASTVSNVVEADGGLSVKFAPVKNENLDNPSSLVFERRAEPLKRDPIRTGSLDGIIRVRGGSGDDESVLNPFESLDAALKSAAPTSVVWVYPHSGSETYGNAKITGRGLPEQHNLTIRKAPSATETPTIGDLTIGYQGQYYMRSLHISGTLETQVNGIYVDAERNYWGTADGPVGSAIRVQNEDTSNVVSEPFCTDSTCTSFGYTDYIYCIEVNEGGSSTRINCNSGESPDFKVTFENGVINPAADKEYKTGKRQIPIKIKKNANTELNISFNVVGSDVLTDKEMSFLKPDSGFEGNINATFGGRIDRMNSAQLSFNPRVEVKIGKRKPVTVELSDSTTLTNPEFDSRVITELSPQVYNQNAVIVGGGFTGLTENQTRYVTRYNDGTDTGSFQTDSIPPTKSKGGELVDASRGTLQQFANMRTVNGRPAIVTPNSPVRVGFSLENIPSASNHVLNITYGYQAEDVPQNNLDLQIVDANGREIETSRNIELTPTINGTVSGSLTKADIKTNTLRIPLTEKEIDYVNEEGSIYFTIENEKFTQPDKTTLLLYNARLETSDNVSDLDEPASDNTGGTDTPQQELTTDITATLDVSGSINSEYGTYDVEPGQELDTTITVTNNGETTISGDYVLRDIYSYPEQAYPGENYRLQDSSVLSRQKNVTVKTFQAELEPGESKTISVSLTWSELEFGNHTVQLFKVEDDGSLTAVADKNGDPEKFNAYVFQEATIEIVDVRTPDEHMVYDNFNSEVVVRNVGDLAGTQTIKASFGSWSGNATVSVGSGDARDGETSENVTVRFGRDKHPKSQIETAFTRREYTTRKDVVDKDFSTSGPFELGTLSYDTEIDSSHYRPNAPFHTETGKFVYTAKADNQFNNSVENRTGVGFISVQERMDSTSTNKTELYQIEINAFRVSTNPETSSGSFKLRPTAENATIYASAWPYTYPSFSNPSVVPYSQTYPVYDGEGTLFSADTATEQSTNRGGFPLNVLSVNKTRSPSDRYFSSYYTHQVRYCNPSLLAGDNAVHVPEADADESDTSNVFIAFSGNGCDNASRYIRVQAPRFVGTTNETVFSDSISGDTTSPVSIEYPALSSISSEPRAEAKGVNASSFSEIDDDGRAMFAQVIVSNEGRGQPATARFEIVTNQSVPEPQIIGIGKPGGFQSKWGTTQFDDNVVGAGAVELQPGETKRVTVPIIIRNNKGAAGVHELSVRPRSAGVNNSKDYITYTADATPPSEIEPSPITGEKYDQFTTAIKVETYADVVLRNVTPTADRTVSDSNTLIDQADVVVDEVCRSSVGTSAENRSLIDDSTYNSYGMFSPDRTEGLNTQSGSQPNDIGVVRDDGLCNASTGVEQAQFKANWSNFGGEYGVISPSVLGEFEPTGYYTRLHIRDAQATGDRFFTTNYQNDGTFDGYTNATEPSTLSIDPSTNESTTFGRRFQDPGLYHVRVAPCRDIEDQNLTVHDGPMRYNLEGLTGIPDTLDAPTNGTNFAAGIHPTVYRNHYRTTTGGSNTFGDPNAYLTTEEMRTALFHGARGCSKEVSSVFVFDTTDPVADWRIAVSRSAEKRINNTAYDSRLEDQTTANGVEAGESHDTFTNDPSFEVHQGALLWFDGSSYDCNNCYSTPQPRNVDNVIGGSRLSSSRVEWNNLSTDNAQITNMTWTIGGRPPNYGQVELCEKVSDTHPDQSCYMEAFGGTRNYEVVAHRFNNGSTNVQLKVGDDTRLTKNGNNTNTTSVQIDVVEDNDRPEVNIIKEKRYDLSYGLENNNGVWHRDEEVVEYQSGLDGISDPQYDNTYEGGRYCFEVETASDAQIGISQDKWIDLADRTSITDNGGFSSYGDSQTESPINDFDTSETRNGDRRCMLWREGNSNDESISYTYKAWDFVYNNNSDTVTVNVKSDDNRPSSSLSESYQFSDYSYGETGQYVYASSGAEGYNGSQVTFDMSAQEPSSEIGLACIDLRVPPTDGSCQGTAEGTSYSGSLQFYAEQLDYTTGSYGCGDSTTDEKLKSTDWHSNTKTVTETVTIRVSCDSPENFPDQTNQGGSYDYGNNTSPSQESESVTGSFDSGDVPVYSASASCSGGQCVSATVTEGVGKEENGQITVEITFDWTKSQSKPGADATCSSPSSPSCSCGQADTNCNNNTTTNTASTSETVDASATVTITDVHGQTETATYKINDASMTDSETSQDSCSKCKSCDRTGETCNTSNNSNSSSFVGTEQVLTPDRGYIPISQLEEGDKVVSYDTVTRNYTTSVVGDVLTHKAENVNYTEYPLMEITVVSDDGELRTTEVTANHPYYSYTDDDWVQIGNMSEGDIVAYYDSEDDAVRKSTNKFMLFPRDVTREADIGRIIGMRKLDRAPDVVYDLHMKEGPNNYIVQGSVVHNANNNANKK